MLMLASNQFIQNGLRAKVKIHDKVEQMSMVRDALRVMARDINLAYHFRDIESEYKQQVQKNAQSALGPQGTPQPGQPPPTTPPPNPATTANQQSAIANAINTWTRPDPDRKDPTTQFVGSSDELHFITMNSSRLTEDVPQADFVKVSYYLGSCKKPGSTDTSGKCLLRSSDPLVEGDVTKHGPATILVENITELKLRYIGPNKEDWVSDWNSQAGDGGTKDNFPDAVEISLTMEKKEGQKKNKVSMQIIAPVRYANNPPPGGTGVPGGPPPPGGRSP